MMPFVLQVIIVVAVAVRCWCCRPRRGRRTQDKTSNAIATASSNNGPDSIKSNGNGAISPQLPPRPTQMLPLAIVKSNGFSAEVLSGNEQYGVPPATDSSLDQSPDLINDTTTIKWKEQQQAVCLVDGPYSPYGQVIVPGNQYYAGNTTSPLTTISETVLQPQHYYIQNPQMVYPASSVLNPGSYLLPSVPLVDAEGFPIDYGLPRPSRPTRPPHSHVRFADPPSVSVRHYENYVLDGETNQLQPYPEQDILPDRKYPDCYEPLPSSVPQQQAGTIESGQSEIRYPSERYPREYGATADKMILASPPKEFVYPPASNSIETTSSENGGPSSPFDVSISNDVSSGSSPGFLCSSTLQRQPHESPDEGYEDEGIDGTEI